MQTSNPPPLKKSKSKTTLMQKFVDKFKKKRARTKTPPPVPSRETSREPPPPPPPVGREKSPGKSVASLKEKREPRPQPRSQKARVKPTPSKMIDLTEVTAKAFRKDKKSAKASRSTKKKSKKPKEEESSSNVERTLPPAKSPSLIAIRNVCENHVEPPANQQKVEKAVKNWMEALGKIDIRKVFEEEFDPIIATKVELEKCQAFVKYRDLCQSDNLEVLDSNRVRVEGTEFFYHGSVVTAPAITNKTLIMAQLPLREEPHCKEAFWLVVAALKMQRVYVILGPDELDKKAFGEYFPDDFYEHKTIRVNNRKTVPRSEEQTNDQMYYEVVPMDCAEAPFAMMEICDFWPDGKIPTIPGRPAATAASLFESDIDPEATIGVVSNFGAGRPGSFVVGALSIERLRAGEVPNIKDLTITVRSQRPGAVETLPQYIFAHIIPLSYSLKHLKDASLKGKVEKMISQLEQLAFEKMTEEDEDDSEEGGE